MNMGRVESKQALGAYLKNIDNLLSIHFDAVYSVPSFRHDFSRNLSKSTPENLDSGLPRRSLSVGGLKPLPE
jgi:hypothetical protein